MHALLTFVPSTWFLENRGWLLPLLGIFAILIVLRVIWSRVRRSIRRRRGPTIHPKLQKYNVDLAALQAERRELSRGIVATSTSGRLAGYRVVRQVEAVFVEGLPTPDDALIALKASAVERGANAILNVQTGRTAAGKCSASGDAVLVAEVQPRSPQPPA